LSIGYCAPIGITNDDHSVQIGESTVAVTGTSGLVHAAWTLLVDGQEVDQAKAAGDFTLRGTLGDGSAVEARVHQSLLGPTEVAIIHVDEEAARFTGFVV